MLTLGEPAWDASRGRSVAVIYEHPGAPAAVVEREVIGPLERRLAGMPGVERVDAIARQGMARVVVVPRPHAATEAEQSLRRAVTELAASSERSTYTMEQVPLLGERAITIALTGASLDGLDRSRRLAPAVAAALRSVRGTAEDRTVGTDRAAVWNDLPAVAFEVGLGRGPHRRDVDALLVVIDSVRGSLPPGMRLDVVGTWNEAGLMPGWLDQLSRVGLVVILLLLLVGLATRWTRGPAAVAIVASISAAAAVGLARLIGPSPEPSLVVGASLLLPFALADAIPLYVSVVRHRELGDNRWRAITKAVSEVGPGIGVTTTIAVMLMVPIATAARGSVALSPVVTTLVAGVVVSGILTALLLPGLSTSGERVTAVRSRNAISRVQERLDSALENLTDRYHELLAGLIRRRHLAPVFALGALVMAMAVARSGRGADLFAGADSNEIVIDLGVPADSRLEQAARLARTVADIARAHPEVTSTFTTLGDWSGDGTVARVRLLLASSRERSVSATDLARGLRDELNEAGGGAHSVTATRGYADPAIAVQVSGADARTLFGVAQRIADDIRTVGGVVDVRLSTQVSSSDEGPSQIEHVGGIRVAHVYANIEHRFRTATVREVRERVAAVPLPPDYAASVGGSASAEARSIAVAAFAAAIAFGLVWLALAAYLRSPTHSTATVAGAAFPVATVVTILGAGGQPTDTWALLGATVAVALYVKHALPVVNVGRSSHTHATPARVALIESARRAFRPTLGATIAACVALLPLVLGVAGSDERARTLGAALMVAAVVSAVTVLFVLPAFCGWVHETSDARWHHCMAATRRAPGAPNAPVGD